MQITPSIKRSKRNTQSVDEWDGISTQQQRRLKANIKDDVGVDYTGIPELELAPSE